jgi:hypothetical protein
LGVEARAEAKRAASKATPTSPRTTFRANRPAILGTRRGARDLSPFGLSNFPEFAAFSVGGVEDRFVEAGDRGFGGVAEFFEAEEFLDRRQ